MATENQAPEGGDLPNVAKTAPAKIHLVIGEDCPPEADFTDCDEVTWCSQKIDANSITYIRADLAAQPQPDLLRMLAHRARCFPNFPLGYHIPELFAVLGEQPPAAPCAAEGALTDEQIDALWGRYDEGYDTRRALVERILATHPQPKGTPAVPPVEDLLVMAVETGVMRLSQCMDADLQDALRAFAKAVAAAVQAPAPAPVADRREFEVHAAERGFELERYPEGPYVSFQTDKHWQTWRAAQAATQAPAVGAGDAEPVGHYAGEHRDGADLIDLQRDIPKGTPLYTKPATVGAAPHDEWRDLLLELTERVSEHQDHTPQSFAKAMVDLSVRAHKLLKGNSHVPVQHQEQQP